jgi:hypothetical protein
MLSNYYYQFVILCGGVFFWCVKITTERVRFLMTMNIKLVVRLDVMPYIFVDKYQSFGGIRCVPIQPRRFVYSVTIGVTLLDIQSEHAYYPHIQLQSVLLTRRDKCPHKM